MNKLSKVKTTKQKEKDILVRLAKQGNELAKRKLKKDHNTIYWQEAC